MQNQSEGTGLACERPQTMGEEIANAITHGIGAFLSLGCFGVLVSFAAIRGDAWRIVSVSIYGLMMFLMYLASTLYHAAVFRRAKRILNIFDHNAIYLMIAGSYTPFALVALRAHSPGWGWSIFGLVWGCAIVGIIFQTCFINRFRVLSTVTYVLMGWVCIIAVYPLWQAIGTAGIIGIVLGGVCYTAGVIFYVLKQVKYTHAVWHLFVLGGTLIHFFTILYFVIE